MKSRACRSSKEIRSLEIFKTFLRALSLYMCIIYFNKLDLLNQEDKELMNIAKNKNSIIVINKIELNQACQLQGVKISAKNRDIKSLKEEIKKKVGYSYNYENKPLLTNARQIGLLESSLKNIENGLKELEKNSPIDLVSIDITKALLDIEDILGNRSKLDLSEQIFSRFCLGK